MQKPENSLLFVLSVKSTAVICVIIAKRSCIKKFKN